MKTFDQKTKKWVSGVVAVNHDPPHWDEVRASHFDRLGRRLIWLCHLARRTASGSIR